MKKLFTSFFCLMLFFSCNTKQENKGSKTTHTQDTFASLQETVLANLPDSLQPRTILLEIMQKPKTVRLNQAEKIAAGFSSIMQNYTTENGLVLDVISCSFADKKGNLWFGTFVGGASKYDGKTFTSYTKAQGLISNEINSIMEDRNGNIWFSTPAGISKFNGSIFLTVGNLKEVHCILEEKDGIFWFGTKGGLYKYNGKLIKRYSKSDGLSGNEIFDLKKDKNGDLWIGTENGLCKYNGIRFTTFHKINEWPQKAIRKLCIAKNGNIWAGTFYGYIKYNGEIFTYFPFKEFNALPPAIIEDRFGNIWFSNEGEGVSCYNGKSFSYLNRYHGLTSDHVTSIIEDRSGNLWISTDAGISKYAGAAFTNYTQAQGLADNSIRSIMEDNEGSLWFAGNSHGISRFDGKFFINYGVSQGLPGELFWCIFYDKSGNIWMGSMGDDGLIKFDGISFTTYTNMNGLSDNNVRCITEDSKGHLWIGTNRGVNKFDGKSFTHFLKPNGLANNSVWNIVEDTKGNIWIGTEDGVSRYDGQSFTNYYKTQGLGDNHIKSITEDNSGNMWFGSYGGGLSRYDGRSFYTYTTEQGLPDNTVTQVTSIKDGNIIVGTNFGIAVLTGFKSTSSAKTIGKEAPKDKGYYPAHNKLTNDQLKNSSPVFEIYNSKTGYPIKDVNRGQKAVFVDSKGILWIATGSEKSGLVRFDYNALNKNNSPPELNITAIKVDNEIICWNDLLRLKKSSQESNTRVDSLSTPAYITEEVTTFGGTLSSSLRSGMQKKFNGVEFDSINKFYPVPQNLILPYGHNNITIEFGAVEPSKPNLVQYQYKLEGYDKDWSTPSNLTRATFGNMFEGTYRFYLKAQSPSGVWSEPITYSFKVLPPSYRTWWAYAAYVLVFLGGQRIFSKWRERKLQNDKERLEKTVEKRTEELVKEKKKSDDLLLNILPEEVAEELKIKGSADAKQFDMVTVLFTDFKDFTQLSEKMTAEELVEEIHNCFKEFDNITEKYGIEKIKTIGDSYMCAGGLPIVNNTHAKDVVSAGLEIQQFIQNRTSERTASGKGPFEVRIGVHTGPVVAGIVGVKKFAYDIWGDTVNTASRMETSGEAGKVNISGITYELVKEHFNCIHRGKIQAKGKGEIDMYFVDGCRS